MPCIYPCNTYIDAIPIQILITFLSYAILLTHHPPPPVIYTRLSITIPRQVSIGSGGYHTLALTQRGEVYAWGHHRVHQLGPVEESQLLRNEGETRQNKTRQERIKSVKTRWDGTGRDEIGIIISSLSTNLTTIATPSLLILFLVIYAINFIHIKPI